MFGGKATVTAVTLGTMSEKEVLMQRKRIELGQEILNVCWRVVFAKTESASLKGSRGRMVGELAKDRRPEEPVARGTVVRHERNTRAENTSRIEATIRVYGDVMYLGTYLEDKGVCTMSVNTLLTMVIILLEMARE
jgi:hypothetical protein